MDKKELVDRFNRWSPEPLLCSQGGIPYNKAHLDAKDAEIAKLYDERQKLDHAVRDLHAEIDRLRAALVYIRDNGDYLMGSSCALEAGRALEQNVPRRCCSNYPSCYCDQESPEHK